MASSGATSLPAALALVDQLDSALAQMLPDEQGVASGDLQAASKAAQSFARTARDLELMLLSMRKLQPATEEEQLQLEVHQLQAEIARKDHLMEECKTKINAWHQTCEELMALHQRNANPF